MKKCLIALICLASVFAKAQSPIQTFIDDGYSYLDGHDYGGVDIKEAKKNFRLAKWLSFNKRQCNKARIGLALCQIAEQDTIAGIKRLKCIIGFANYSKIEKEKFGNLRKHTKEQWDAYYATQSLISLYIAKKDYLKAESYLTYLEKYIYVKWYCGSGSLGHTMFINEVKAKIAAAN